MRYDAADFLTSLFGRAVPMVASIEPVGAEPAALDQLGPMVNDLRDAPVDDGEHRARFPCSKPASCGEWSADVVALANAGLLLSPDNLPAAPFDFGPAAVVVDASKFLASIKADIQCGPAGPRAMYGAIQADLQRLRELLHNSQDITLHNPKYHIES